MPELPEVETIRLGLASIIGKKVKDVFRSEKKLRIDSKLDLKRMENAVVEKINRRARYLLIDFAGDLSLIIHLGMTGRLVFKEEKKLQKQKHDHLIIKFTDGSSLVFNDARRFGFVDLLKKGDLSSHPSISKLGLEPFLEEFNFSYLAPKLKGKSGNIKTAMMSNDLVVGVGNIYINESLFLCKISPERKCNSLTDDEIKSLIAVIKKVLAKAIKSGGSSISDYVNSAGKKGSFQNSFTVYGREKEKCLICSDLIKKIRQSGRSSFYCPNCQK